MSRAGSCWCTGSEGGNLGGRGGLNEELSSTNWLIKTQPPCRWGKCSNVGGSLARNFGSVCAGELPGWQEQSGLDDARGAALVLRQS